MNNLGPLETSLHSTLVRAANNCAMGREKGLLDLGRLLRDLLQRGQADPVLQDDALWDLRALSFQILQPSISELGAQTRHCNQVCKSLFFLSLKRGLYEYILNNRRVTCHVFFRAVIALSAAAVQAEFALEPGLVTLVKFSSGNKPPVKGIIDVPMKLKDLIKEMRQQGKYKDVLYSTDITDIFKLIFNLIISIQRC